MPFSSDFVVTGDFNGDSEKDVLFAAKGGSLYLMAGVALAGSCSSGDKHRLNRSGLLIVQERTSSVMRVAAIYDIHENLSALEAVLQEVDLTKAAERH